MFASSPPPSAPSALSKTMTTAARFIHVYYKTMAQDPEKLYDYYDDDSSVVRVTGEQLGDVKDHEASVGQLAIHELFLKQNYLNCKVKIETVDAQDSLDGSIIVLVTGLLALAVNGQLAQPVSFVHNFLLVRLADTAGYYVRNDLLRTLEHLPVVAQSVAPQQTNAQATETKPKSPVVTPLPVVDGKLQAAEMASPARTAPRRVSLSHPTPVDPNAPHMPDTLAPPLSPERKAIAAVAPSSPPKSAPVPPATAASVVVTEAPAPSSETAPAENAQPAANAGGKQQGGRRGSANRGKAANAKQAQNQNQPQASYAKQTPNQAQNQQPTQQQPSQQPAAPAKPMSWANRVAVKTPAVAAPAQSSTPAPAAQTANVAASPQAPVQQTTQAQSTNQSTNPTPADSEGEFKPVGRNQRKPRENQNRGDGERSERGRGGSRGGRGGRGGAA